MIFILFLSLIQHGWATILSVPENEKKQQIGNTLAKIQQQPLHGKAEDFSGEGGMSSILKGMARVPGPTPRLASRTYIRPNLERNCDRDYSIPCPIGFVVVGVVRGNVSSCAAGEAYTGPCDDAYTLKSDASKALFAEQCGADWPCRQCLRNFAAPCPAGWDHDGTSCNPPSTYNGPCRDDFSGFTGFNVAMRQRWSTFCDAWWPCAHNETQNKAQK